jgi:diguanylate cyclase (GGDEF)-like protein
MFRSGLPNRSFISAMARSLLGHHLITSLLSFVGLAIIGVTLYLMLVEAEERIYHGILSDQMHRTVKTISQRLDAEQQRLDSLAQQNMTVSALTRGGFGDRERVARLLQSELPKDAAIYLLPVGSEQKPQNSGAVPELCHGFASRRALEPGTPRTEFHHTDAVPTHFDLLAPVKDEQQTLQGYLLLSLPAVTLQSLLNRLGPLGQAQLRQASGDIPETGRDETRSAFLQTQQAAPQNLGPIIITTVANTHWQIALKPTKVNSAYNPIFANPTYLIVIVGLLALIVAVWIRHHQRLRKSIRHDIKSTLRIFKDVRDGSMRVDYPMQLTEFTEIFGYLRKSGKKMVKEKKKLKNMGLIDHLSQLSNRRHFEMRLKELFELSKTHGPSSVLIIDVDHFKAVNDNYGHDAGDALIVGFAKALRTNVRQTDFLARLGGDEFCIIYTYSPLEQAYDVVERLRRQLPRQIPLTKGHMHELRWTGGLSVVSTKDEKFDDVLWRADQALIKAKEAGRNTVRTFAPMDDDMALKQAKTPN